MNKYSLIFVVLVVLFFSVVFKTDSDLVYLFFLLAWLFFSKFKRMDGRYSLAAGLIFLFFCPLVFNIDSLLAQRLACWAFLFFVSGVLLLVCERENRSL